MALRQATTFRGLPVPDGYWRVERISIRDKTKARARIILYKSEDVARAPVTEDGERPESLDLRTVDFEYDPEGANVTTQAYNAAKLRPTFEGAVDVLKDGQDLSDRD